MEILSPWNHGHLITLSCSSQGAVMKRYKEMVHTATICAFNPMIDDFLNARFFLGDAFGRQLPGGLTADGRPAPAPGTAAANAPSGTIPGGAREGLEGGRIPGEVPVEGDPTGSSSAESGMVGHTALAADRGTKAPFSVGASDAAIVQPEVTPSARSAAAAEAAAEASRLRQLRLKDQQLRQLKKPVMPDAAGLPAWAQEKLRKRQEVMQQQSDEHHASVAEEIEAGKVTSRVGIDRTDRKE